MRCTLFLFYFAVLQTLIADRDINSMANSSKWLDLPEDLVISAAKRMTCKRDLFHFNAACRSWRSIVNAKENFKRTYVGQ